MEIVVNQFVKAVLTDLLNNHGELILEPIKIEMGFEFSYKFSVKNEFGIVVTFFLDKFKNSSPYSIGVFIKSLKAEDDFMLSDWLKYEGYKFDKDPFTFTTYHVDDLNFQIQGVIDFLRETFENKKLKEILQGKYWDETPFNWGGLK